MLCHREIVAVALLCCLSVAASQVRDSALTVYTGKSLENGQVVEIAVDPAKLEVLILPTSSKSSGFSSRSPSLEAFVNSQARKRSNSRPLVMMSAGFSRYDPTSSAGLIVEDHIEVAPLAIRNSPLTGVLCIPRAGEVLIASIQHYLARENSCRWAIQGRLLLDDDNPRFVADHRDREREVRLVACSLVFPTRGQSLTFVMFTEATVLDIRRIFKSTYCKGAMLLATPEQSAITWPSNFPNRERDSLGTTDAPVPAIILISERL